jgi:hypothetical protein
MRDVVLFKGEIIAVPGDSLLIAMRFPPDFSDRDKENNYYEHPID